MHNTQTTNQTPAGSNKLRLHPKIIELLSKRGVEGEDLIEYFSWDLKSLNNLTKLQDLELAANRIIHAIDREEKIGVYGDYDVDGTTSCALLYYFFEMLGVEADIVQPSRFIEGYGIHPPSIDEAIEKDIKVLITVDCGITNNEAADYAKERGLDLIITDHHKDAKEEMPAAYAVVNPNRRDEMDPDLKALAGVGVAFCLCLKIKNILEEKGEKIPSIYPLLQFVAIGTICDLAPINNLNRKLIRHGLKQIPETKYEGIKTFFTPEERAAGVVLSEKMSFNIGPLINSKGRLDHPEYAFKTLVSKTHEEAFAFYAHLENCNNDRKFIQGQVYKEAREQVAKNNLEKLPIAIVYSPEWHEGVIGIVASRIVEEFKVPAIVFTNAGEENIIKASARTAGELDLHSTLNEYSDYFLKFGGHKAAAGLSMEKEKFEEFKEKISADLAAIPPIIRTKEDIPDCELEGMDITPTFLKQLEALEPFGGENPKPLFHCSDLQLESYDLLKEVHVRWGFTSIANPKLKFKGISFNYIGKYNLPHPDQILEAQKQSRNISYHFRLGLNRFRGNQYIQLQVEDIKY